MPSCPVVLALQAELVMHLHLDIAGVRPVLVFQGGTDLLADAVVAAPVPLGALAPGARHARPAGARVLREG